MSFTSPGKRNSGGKGISGGKKPKRRKQEFHEHNVRRSGVGAARPDLRQLKERVIIALDRLGHQRFSTEPGGYGLENWMKNFRLLLDDFEEDVGRANLPIEYAERRVELTATLSKPIDTSSIDMEIDGFKREEEEWTKRIEGERARLNGKIEALKSEQAGTSREVAELRRRLAEEDSSGKKKNGERHPKPFFKRLLGSRTEPGPAESAAARLKELESSLESLQGQIVAQQRIRGLLNERDASSDSPYAEEWRKLESLRTGLQKLESVRRDMVQLTVEREKVSSAIAVLVSGISLGGPKTGGDAGAVEG